MPVLQENPYRNLALKLIGIWYHPVLMVTNFNMWWLFCSENEIMWWYLSQAIWGQNAEFRWLS
jgi:hypothetical protein